MKSLIAIADPWPKHTAGCCVRHEQEEETQNPRDQAAGGDCFCHAHTNGAMLSPEGGQGRLSPRNNFGIV